MSRIASHFLDLSKHHRTALVVYLTAHDPDFEQALEGARAAIRGGADLLEIGIPFSDPVADGPTIETAMNRALASGGSLKKALKMVRILRKETDIPLVLFGYCNPFLSAANTLEEAMTLFSEAGADGLLVVDVPPEEAAPWRTAARQADLDWVSLITPSGGSERRQEIARHATGFIYLVSMAGVTGGALTSTESLSSVVEEIRAVCHLPTCIGFGIKTASVATQVAHIADGVVVGSAIVDVLQQHGANGVYELVNTLRQAIDTSNTVDTRAENTHLATTTHK